MSMESAAYPTIQYRERNARAEFGSVSHAHEVALDPGGGHLWFQMEVALSWEAMGQILHTIESGEVGCGTAACLCAYEQRLERPKITITHVRIENSWKRRWPSGAVDGHSAVTEGW